MSKKINEELSPESIVIEIECSGSDFLPYWNIEVARALKQLSDQFMEGDEVPRYLKGLDGNKVGSIIIK